MNEIIDLTKGGQAVVIHYGNGLVKEFQDNPTINFINTNIVQDISELTNLISDNTKVIILTDGIGNLYYQWIMSFCRRKNIPYLLRKTNDAINQTLKSFFPNESIKPSISEVKETQERGKLQSLVEYINFSESNTWNAKKLMRICLENNIKTTEGSLAQFVSNQRRKLGATGIVKSVRPKLDVMVEMFDGFIKDLNEYRDFIIETVDENRTLKKRLEDIEKALGR